MKIDVRRIRRAIRYEYTETKSVDTSQFPECENMTLPQRLEWCVTNADRVWDDEFWDFINGDEHDDWHENDDGRWVYVSPHGEDNWSDVWDVFEEKLQKTGDGPGQVDTKYPGDEE